jgi:nucleotide-binding universal stress UspA family protein
MCRRERTAAIRTAKGTHVPFRGIAREPSLDAEPARVPVVRIRDAGQQSEEPRGRSPIEQFLRAAAERTRGDKTPSEIERAAHDVGADLLVLGAYSRNRFRELVFGGATEHMLFKTDLPVLMLHR